MNIQIENELALVVKVAELDEKQSLISMHLSEIETEAEKMLELLTVARSHAFRNDTESTQETLAELVISLEHLSHHVNHVLPELQRCLDIDIAEPAAPKTLRERPTSLYTTKPKRGSRNGKKRTGLRAPIRRKR